MQATHGIVIRFLSRHMVIQLD